MSREWFSSVRPFPVVIRAAFINPAATQTGGKERTTEELDSSPSTSSRLICTPSQTRVPSPSESEGERRHRSCRLTGFLLTEACPEKTTPPEEALPAAKEEPEPVFIDQVRPRLSGRAAFSQTGAPVLSPQGKMDRTLALLQSADPADLTPDSSELLQLEGTAPVPIAAVHPGASLTLDV